MPAKPAPRKPVNGKALGGKPAPNAPNDEPKILFQKYFKSVGPRTYAAQLKQATNLNHFLVLTEGKRDEATGEVRKTRIFVFSEDFVPFFRMLHETAQFMKANPVPEEVRKRRERYWSKKAANQSEEPGRPSAAVPASPSSTPSSRSPTPIAGGPKPNRPQRKSR